MGLGGGRLGLLVWTWLEEVVVLEREEGGGLVVGLVVVFVGQVVRLGEEVGDGVGLVEVSGEVVGFVLVSGLVVRGW